VSRIDGKAIAATIRVEIREQVDAMKAAGNVPGLAVVLVGARPDSASYVQFKKKACAECGIADIGVDLPATATEADIVAVVEELNANPAVHGILVQLPLPAHVSEERVLEQISIEKDVDGFHPLNIGNLAMKGREPMAVPCTPKGCIELLDRSGVEISGKNAVVLGRSNIVGIPVAMLLLARNATVTIVHSRTADIPAVVSQADIVVAAVGRPRMVKAEWLKEGAVVIDVGINQVADTRKGKEGKTRLVGDVDYPAVRKANVAAMITPVPGGVGPMTIAMLMQNTLECARRTFAKGAAGAASPLPRRRRGASGRSPRGAGKSEPGIWRGECVRVARAVLALLSSTVRLPLVVVVPPGEVDIRGRPQRAERQSRELTRLVISAA
jgi:5,10-methylene-tetrahydrofolate dehydrogenase/methenyl tetrahydrofolate cyclohydrolase